MQGIKVYRLQNMAWMLASIQGQPKKFGVFSQYGVANPFAFYTLMADNSVKVYNSTTFILQTTIFPPPSA